MRKSFFILLFAFVVATLCRAQEFTWSVDFQSVFDNREGDDANDQTIFFTRLAPEVGVKLPGGEHRISGGVVWNQPVGNGWHDHKICPTLYYRFDKDSWKLNFGMFSRDYLIEPTPKFLWSDSIAYEQPNVRGVLVQYVKPRGYLEMMLDWRQLQSETQREAFNVMLNSRYSLTRGGVLQVGERLQYNHLAKQKDAPDGQSVNDDFMFNPWIGVNFGQSTGLDSLNIRIGAVLSMQRSRIHADGWQNAAGVLAEVAADWRWLGLRETFYAGKNLMPLYPYYGAELNMGSPYYQAKTYSRTDLVAHIVRNNYVDLEAALNFHVTGDVFALWQQLSLRVYIDQNLVGSKHKSSQRKIRNMY
ncbi:MAG: hypothetical protein ACI4AH_00090 [Muribaculaceae bacterium]